MSNEKTNNWKDAPEWAMYRAVDRDGYINWFEQEPTPFPSIGSFLQLNLRLRWETGARLTSFLFDWQNSLERRPEPQKLNDWESAGMENDTDSVYTIAATFGPAQDKEPVTWEWLESVGFLEVEGSLQMELKRGNGYLYAFEYGMYMRLDGGVEYDIHVPDADGELTREKALNIISVFS